MSESIAETRALYLVTGLTGAGKSSVLDTLGDLGFIAVDNLPVELLPDFLELASADKARYARCALLLDISAPTKVENLLRSVRDLRASSKTGTRLELMFIDCDTERIINRYSETRRPHPGFKPEVDQRLEDTIQRERALLMPVKEQASFVVDTTRFNIHQLRREIKAFADKNTIVSGNQMRVNILSFGFKYGIPIDCDLLMDVRFLSNPYFRDDLRDKSGKDQDVFDYVVESEDAKGFLANFQNLLTYLVPRYVAEGKSYLTIAMGCTGGRHRSVAIAERLFSTLKDQNCDVSIKHRDIERFSHLQRE